MLKQRFVTTNGVRLNVLLTEKIHTETIVFLHYSNGDATVWNALLPYFENDYNIVIPEFRGHGDSDKPERGYTMDYFVDDLLGLFDELGLDQVHIVGSSLGVDVAVKAIPSLGSRVLSFICEGPPQSMFGPLGVFDLNNQEKEEKIQELLHERSQKQYSDYVTKQELINAGKQNIVNAGLPLNEYISTTIEQNVFETNEGTFRWKMPRIVMDEFMEDFYHINFENLFKAITCPVLFIPSEDEWASESFCNFLDELNQSLPYFKAVKILGASHAFTLFFQYEEMAAAIKTFLEQIKTSGIISYQ
ncbi:alpha/beta hydrolase [Cytobacillus suaedae]|nr:alpha/beta hydrolase [Cytobacillus suaedae]